MHNAAVLMGVLRISRYMPISNTEFTSISQHFIPQALGVKSIGTDCSEYLLIVTSIGQSFLFISLLFIELLEIKNLDCITSYPIHS